MLIILEQNVQLIEARLIVSIGALNAIYEALCLNQPPIKDAYEVMPEEAGSRLVTLNQRLQHLSSLVEHLITLQHVLYEGVIGYDPNAKAVEVSSLTRANTIPPDFGAQKNRHNAG